MKPCTQVPVTFLSFKQIVVSLFYFINQKVKAMYKKIFLGKDVFGLFPSPLHQLILKVRNSPYNRTLSVCGTYLASTWTCILQSDTEGGGKKVERKERVSLNPFLWPKQSLHDGSGAP